MKLTIEGTGSPEGVVTAPPGRVYVDLATGATWSKKAGTGNTGWGATGPTTAWGTYSGNLNPGIGGFGFIPFAAVAGADLLDLTAPAAPKFRVPGVYAVTLQISTSGGADGEIAQASIDLDFATTGFTVEDSWPLKTGVVTYGLQAATSEVILNALLKVGADNSGSAADVLYTMFAFVQRTS